jgi:hypothetical protein
MSDSALQRRLALVVAVAASSTSLTCQADPVRLAYIDRGPGTTTLTTANPAQFTGTEFTFNMRDGPTLQDKAFLFSSRFDGFFVGFGTTGTFDFNGTNASGFTSMAALFTDAINDEIENGQLHPGGGGSLRSQVEANALGGLLTGDTVDFFRLVVLQNSLDVTQISAQQFGVNMTYQIRWEVWGSGPIVLTPPGTVPEPSSWLLALSAIALAAQGSTFTKRRSAPT